MGFGSKRKTKAPRPLLGGRGVGVRGVLPPALILHVRACLTNPLTPDPSPPRRGEGSPKSCALFSGLCTALLTFFALITSIATSPAHAQGIAFPSLKPNPVARGTQITLGDIFANAGPAAATPLARAPGPGQRVVFGAPSLQARANGAGLRWTNPEGVREVVVSGGPRSGAATTSIPQSSTPDVAPSTLAVLSRSVARGATIEASDVVWMDSPANTPRDALSDPDALIGKTAKRTLMANTALRAADVMDTPAVRRGEAVTLMFEAGGLRLSVRGRALADAPVGAVIKVLNPQSNKTLDAMVESPGVARVLSSHTSGRVVAQIGSN